MTNYELESLLTEISQANDVEINQMLDAITERYKKFYPDWDIAFLALPLKNTEQRKMILKDAISLLQRVP